MCLCRPQCGCDSYMTPPAVDGSGGAFAFSIQKRAEKLQLLFVLGLHLETREPASTVRAVEQEARGLPSNTAAYSTLSGLCQETVMSLFIYFFEP